MLKKLFLCLLPVWFAACGSAPSETSSLSWEFEATRYPSGPHHDKTPGETCKDPDNYRYPERIAYCNRDVSSSTKRAIISDYDREYGYEIGKMNRGDFKIDHYIPLCMGGSNSVRNLWPQHKSVYEKTDPLEPMLCQLMASGKMLQADAIEKIRFAKNNLDQAAQMVRELDALINN